MTPRFTPQARGQFRRALARIPANDPLAAARLFSRVEMALERLAKFPRLGRRIPEFPTEPTREILVPPYRLFYEVDQGVVWITGVWHSKQRPGSPERPEGGRKPRG